MRNKIVMNGLTENALVHEPILENCYAAFAKHIQKTYIEKVSD